MKTYMTVEFSDKSVYQIPSMIVARHRAAYYAHEYGNDIDKSLEEDTLPLFEDSFEIEDWASNNMDWSDLEFAAILITCPVRVDYDDEWVNAKKAFK